MHGGHNWCSPRSGYFYWDLNISTSPARASWSPSFSSSYQAEAQRQAFPQDRPQKSPQSHRLAFDQIGFGQIGSKRKIGFGQIVSDRTGSGTRTVPVVGTGSEAESWSGTDSDCWGTAGWTVAHYLETAAQTERLAAPTAKDSHFFYWSKIENLEQILAARTKLSCCCLDERAALAKLGLVDIVYSNIK